MLYLLTDEQKKKVLREYRMRLAVVIMIALSFVGVIAVVSIIPSKVLVSSHEQILNFQQKSIERGSSSNVDDLSKKIADISKTASYLEPLGQSLSASGVFNHLEKLAGDKNSINQFTINHFDETASVQISGISKNRDALIKFVDSLKKDPWFGGATLPYSSLAKQDNLSFTLNLVINLSKLKI
jgi:multidrug efflux pump subunit AcrB